MKVGMSCASEIYLPPASEGLGKVLFSVCQFTFDLLATCSELAAFLQWLNGFFADRSPAGGMPFAVSHRRTFLFLFRFGYNKNDQGGHIRAEIKFPVFSLSFPCVTNFFPVFFPIKLIDGFE